MDENRKNFFGDRVHPTADYQALEWYWPTDEEFKLIELIVLDGERFAHYIRKYGEDNARLLLEELLDEGGMEYLWLAKHLSVPTEGQVLAESQVRSSLETFELEVVEPWLAKWGKDYGLVT